MAAIVRVMTEPPTPAVTRLSIDFSGPQVLVVGGLDRDFALSPDGTRLVYIGANGSQLFVRRMDSLDAMPLGGLAAPRGPFTSPDGAWVGFFDGVGTIQMIKPAGTADQAAASLIVVLNWFGELKRLVPVP